MARRDEFVSSNERGEGRVFALGSGIVRKNGRQSEGIAQSDFWILCTVFRHLPGNTPENVAQFLKFETTAKCPSPDYSPKHDLNERTAESHIGKINYSSSPTLRESLKPSTLIAFHCVSVPWW
jgi:hypothetical protein